MISEIDITVDRAEIERKSQDEKINILINLGFANRRSINRMETLLIGNGKEEGLCDIVRSTRRNLLWLWAIFSAASGAYFTVLIYHLAAIQK